MFVVDTNVLIYAANESCPEYRRCRQLLEAWRVQSSAWYVSWSILYGFVRITTHPRVLPQPWGIADAWRFVEALLASPGLAVLTETDRHSSVATGLIGDVPDLNGNLVSDLHIAALMKEHGIKTIYTRDVGFHRFRFLDVRDPLQVH